MFDDRLAEFSRERLGGRPIPEDLQVLLIAQWEGRDESFGFLDFRFLEPGEVDPLCDHSYLNEQARADPDVMAGCAASLRMAQYLKVFATREDGEFYGYWVHSDEPADQPAPVVLVDSEGSYWVLRGSTFIEACLDWYDPDSDDEFAEMAEDLARQGVPITARSFADLRVPEIVRDPEDVHREFYNAEREKLGLKPV